MSKAVSQVASEQAKWHKNDEEHRKSYEVLTARIGAEARTRERLERELERLEAQEREGMKLKILLDQTQGANSRLEDTAKQLRIECSELQKTADRYAREYHEAREAGRAEVQRTRILMEAQLEAANNSVNIVRRELEGEISLTRAELENVRLDADTAKAKHELDLEQAADERRDGIREAMEARNIALQEQQQNHEHRMEALRHQHELYLADLRQQQTRVIANAYEDKQRSEALLNERLTFADSKIDHLEDKVLHLEDKLEVAKSAAHAAAVAAQSAKAPVAAAATTSTSKLPEKVSPQALRESIVVLQEQLQEREGRIEGLEQELDQVDKDAPAKLKERDTEIGWLRELLGLRIDDISDLVNMLSQPAFDRTVVRDTAIRIRTNLQMEQQEKERLMRGGQLSHAGQSIKLCVSQGSAANGCLQQLAQQRYRPTSYLSVSKRQP